jgi:hypothetical protein
MATQNGVHILGGAIGKVIYYEMNGKSFARRKSEPDKQRLKTHVNYVKTRMCNDRWREATAIVKKMYREIPKEKKVHGLYGRLTGMASQLLAKEMIEEEVVRELWEIVTNLAINDFHI